MSPLSSYNLLRENGVVEINLNLNFYNALCTTIYSLFDAHDYPSVAHSLYSSSESVFSSYSKKFNRIFSGASCVLCEQIANLPQIQSAIGSSNLIVTPISEYERRFRPDLSADSPDFFYRIVRYNHISDIGLPHFDRQFWDLSAGTSAQPDLPPYKRLWKVWIPLAGTNLLNCLRFVPGSHKSNLPIALDTSKVTQTSLASGSNGSPSIDKRWVHAHLENFLPFAHLPGSCNVFNDTVVHTGPINTSSPVRLSAEFTLAEL